MRVLVLLLLLLLNPTLSIPSAEAVVGMPEIASAIIKAILIDCVNLFKPFLSDIL
jgi:hypothetical protein